MRGVVACEALYPLLERLGGEAPIRYIPAELHEFPLNVPVDTAIAERVQGAVDALDGLGLDAIVVTYATAGEGLVGVRSRDTPLAVWRLVDCTSAVLPGEGGTFGENKAQRTLYLPRGWIDCGVDSYKLYKAYRGETAELEALFEQAKKAHPSLRITWADGDRFERTTVRFGDVSPDTVDRFFHSVVRYYDTVALVDTDDFYDLHYEYASTVRDFIARLRKNHGSGRDVGLTTIEGQTDRVESLLTGDLSDTELVETYQPGAPVE